MDPEMMKALLADAEKLRALGADVEDPVFLDDANEPVCVNAHDRCFGGAGGPCPYCEFKDAEV